MFVSEELLFLSTLRTEAGIWQEAEAHISRYLGNSGSPVWEFNLTALRFPTDSSSKMNSSPWVSCSPLWPFQAAGQKPSFLCPFCMSMLDETALHVCMTERDVEVSTSVSNFSWLQAFFSCLTVSFSRDGKHLLSCHTCMICILCAHSTSGDFL